MARRRNAGARGDGGRRPVPWPFDDAGALGSAAVAFGGDGVGGFVGAAHRVAGVLEEDALATGARRRHGFAGLIRDVLARRAVFAPKSPAGFDGATDFRSGQMRKRCL